MNERYELTEWQIAPPAPPLLRERSRRWPWRKWLTATFLTLAWLAAIYLMFQMRNTGIFYVCLIATIGLYNRAKFGRAGLDVRDLMDLPPVVPQYPVEVVYHYRNAVYGSDNGIVSFVDGSMNFQGRKSRFSLTHAHLVNASEATPSNIASPRHRYLMTFAYGEGTYLIALRSFDSVPGVGVGFQAKFRAAFHRYHAPSNERSQPALLPPLTSDPEARKMFLKMRAVAVALLLASLAAVIYGVAIWAPRWETWIWEFQLVAFGAAGIAAARLLYRNWVDPRILKELSLRATKKAAQLDETKPTTEPQILAPESGSELAIESR